MNILKWIKEHVRPYVKYNNPYGDYSDIHNDINISNVNETVHKIEDRTEIGIQLEFKF
jgi:hypothetical protein